MARLYSTNKIVSMQEIPINKRSTQSPGRVTLARAKTTTANSSVPAHVPVHWTPVVVSSSFFFSVNGRSNKHFTVQEIPIRKKPIQSRVPVASRRPKEPPVNMQRTSSIPPEFIHTCPKQFLKPCDANLEELLALFFNAGIKDESSLMALVVCPRKERMSFLKNNFIDKMTLEQMLVFNKDCELVTRNT
jgi:hypothetical protein